MHTIFGILLSLTVLSQPDVRSLEQQAGWIEELSPWVLSEGDRREARSMIDRDLERRTREVNQRSLAEWRAIRSREDWQRYRDERLQKLRDSLGELPAAGADVASRTTGTLDGEGFRIEKLLFEGRADEWVPAHLYLPKTPPTSMPAIILVHSHHRSKEQGELQDMGMTWARAGCAVLVMDLVGYGERRAHPFHGPQDYPAEFQWERQDYYFRYDSGIQLQLLGDSLMSWFVADIMRAVDLLVARRDIDPNRLIVMGAVAGGGDPAAVAAALDERITACVPFNFGGPQPETTYPLPEDAEVSFDYLAGSYWDGSRGLYRSGADGFLHWVIVGSLAPRRLIYAHEFSWDRQRDPVWKRFERIYEEFYHARDNLAFAHGKGLLRGRPPEASHCTNIGAYHRQMIHPVLRRWFGIEVTPEDEYQDRREATELLCVTPEVRRELQPEGFVELVTEAAAGRSERAREHLPIPPTTGSRERLRRELARRLGPVETTAPPIVRSLSVDTSRADGVRVERVTLEVEPGILVPLLLLSPREYESRRRPAVVALAQSGKAGFLLHRAGEIAELLGAGFVVCLPDVRGTGESAGDDGRGRTGGDTHRSANLWLFGETLLGARLRDLRAVTDYVRSRPDVDSQKISLWGESLTPPNPVAAAFAVPHGVERRPHQSEPLGSLLALLGSVYDDQVRAVYARGGISTYESVLGSPFVYTPHDVVIPSLLSLCDLPDLAALIAPRPLRLEALVDNLNRPLSPATAKRFYQGTLESYGKQNANGNVAIGDAAGSAAEWLIANGR